MAPLSFCIPNFRAKLDNSCARHEFRAKTMNTILSKVRDRRLRKRLPIGFFLLFITPLFLTSCYNTRFLQYDIETRDAKSRQIATVDKNEFSVTYPNFVVRYHTKGKQENSLDNQCEIENYSDSIMVIDLSTSYRNNERLYRNEITTNTYSNSYTTGTGTSINVGNVAAALGAGPRLSTIANGINVGGNNSNTTTNTTQVQTIPDQYIVIPPNGMATIPCTMSYVYPPRGLGNHTEHIGTEVLNMAISYTFLPNNVDGNYQPQFQVYQHKIVVDSEHLIFGKKAYNQSGIYPKNREVDFDMNPLWWCGYGVIMAVLIGSCIYAITLM